MRRAGWADLTTYDFDEIIHRRDSDCAKWRHFEADVIPLWVADMDFRAPDPVVNALRRRVEHSVFGYAHEPPELRPALSERLLALYGWRVAPEVLMPIPGVIPGLNSACRALARPGESAIAFPPVYTPILNAPVNGGLGRDDVALRPRADLRYEKVSYG